jgi:hypothetical protein
MYIQKSDRHSFSSFALRGAEYPGLGIFASISIILPSNLFISFFRSKVAFTADTGFPQHPHRDNALTGGIAQYRELVSEHGK